MLQEFALFPPDQDSALFDKTFDILLQQAMKERRVEQQEDSTFSNTTDKAPTAKMHASKTKGKEKRTWGEAKVTKEAMAELDFSETVVEDGMDVNSTNALAEARAAYLPDANEVNAWEQAEAQD